MTDRRVHTTLLAAAFLFLIAGCGGSRDQSGEPAAEASTSTPSAEPAAPASQPDGPPSPELIAQGEELFSTRACTSCHTIGNGRLVGPDLSGVTNRRTRTWIVSMIMHPDSMLRDDETAKNLFAEYLTPMANQGLTADQAGALYEFLRSKAPSQ